MENIGHAPWYIYNSFHYNGGSPKPQNAGGFGRHFPNEEDLRPENFHNPALEIDYVRVYKRK
ncbi:MAG: hypothetical protein V3U87_18040 [Methylococcaceae bacterium]